MSAFSVALRSLLCKKRSWLKFSSADCFCFVALATASRSPAYAKFYLRNPKNHLKILRLKFYGLILSNLVLNRDAYKHQIRQILLHCKIKNVRRISAIAPLERAVGMVGVWGRKGRRFVSRIPFRRPRKKKSSKLKFTILSHYKSEFNPNLRQNLQQNKRRYPNRRHTHDTHYKGKHRLSLVALLRRHLAKVRNDPEIAIVSVRNRHRARSDRHHR